MVSYIRFGAFLFTIALSFGVQPTELVAQPVPPPPPPVWEFVNPITATPLYSFSSIAPLACDGNAGVAPAAYTVRAVKAATPGTTESIFTGTSIAGIKPTWAGSLPVPGGTQWPTGQNIEVRLYSSNPWLPATIEDIETIRFY